MRQFACLIPLFLCFLLTFLLVNEPSMAASQKLFDENELTQVKLEGSKYYFSVPSDWSKEREREDHYYYFSADRKDFIQTIVLDYKISNDLSAYEKKVLLQAVLLGSISSPDQSSISSQSLLSTTGYTVYGYHLFDGKKCPTAAVLFSKDAKIYYITFSTARSNYKPKEIKKQFDIIIKSFSTKRETISNQSTASSTTKKQNTNGSLSSINSTIHKNPTLYKVSDLIPMQLAGERITVSIPSKWKQEDLGYKSSFFSGLSTYIEISVFPKTQNYYSLVDLKDQLKNEGLLTRNTVTAENPVYSYPNVLNTRGILATGYKEINGKTLPLSALAFASLKQIYIISMFSKDPNMVPNILHDNFLPIVQSLAEGTAENIININADTLANQPKAVFDKSNSILNETISKEPDLFFSRSQLIHYDVPNTNVKVSIPSSWASIDSQNGVQGFDSPDKCYRVLIFGVDASPMLAMPTSEKINAMNQWVQQLCNIVIEQKPVNIEGSQNAVAAYGFQTTGKKNNPIAVTVFYGDGALGAMTLSSADSDVEASILFQSLLVLAGIVE